MNQTSLLSRSSQSDSALCPNPDLSVMAGALSSLALMGKSVTISSSVCDGHRMEEVELTVLGCLCAEINHHTTHNVDMALRIGESLGQVFLMHSC